MAETEDRMVACHHGERKRYARGACRSCYDNWRKAKRPELATRERERKRLTDPAYRAAWKIKKNAENRLKYAALDIPLRRESALRSAYGIGLDEYFAMERSQQGLCAICERPPRGKKNGRVLYVDHSHSTGEIRGLLCAGCNTAIGQFRHSVEILERAIDYLDRPARSRREDPHDDVTINDEVSMARIAVASIDTVWPERVPRRFKAFNRERHTRCMEAVLRRLEGIEAGERLL